MHKLVCYFCPLYLSEYPLFQSHVSSVVEELHNLTVLPLLDCMVWPGIDDLLQLLYLNDNLESFDFLLRLVVLLKTFKALLECLALISLPIEPLELGLHCMNPKSIDSLFEHFVDEEVSADCLQLLLVFLSHCVVKQSKENALFQWFMGFVSDDAYLSLLFGHLFHLTLPKCKFLLLDSPLVRVRYDFLTIS